MTEDRRRSLGRMAELGLLTATLNHELRQPLFAIKSLAQLIQARGGHPPEIGELLRQVEVMQDLVDGVRSFSRHAPQTLAPIDPRAPVEQAVTLLRHRARRRRVSLRVLCEGELGAARCDPSALMQAAVNLIQNAIDASPEGGVVTVQIRGGERIVVDVIDQGPGVPPELRERVFEAFFTTKDASRGTGLGLSIARELVLACEGELLLMDTEEGAHVRIELLPWTG